MTARIDAHQHFWRYAPDTHAWIDDSMEVLRRDFLPEDLAPLLSGRFDGCVTVQAQTNERETRWLLELAERYAFIRGVVGWVDLLSPKVTTTLAALRHDKLVGIRHVLQSEPDGFMRRKDFRRGITALEDTGLAYDILIYERQLAEAEELIRACPRQRFVIDHNAKPDIKNGSFERWVEAIERIAALENAWCKISGMVTEADWSAWTPEQLHPYIEHTLHAFGADRCMIGSDWPVCTLAGTYATVTGVVLEYARRLAPAEQDALLGGTAARFYRLE